MRIDRPANTEPCASEKCGHPFGDHYLSHDGKTSGCSWSNDDQRDGFTICHCTGFLIAYLYKPRGRTMKAKQP